MKKILLIVFIFIFCLSACSSSTQSKKLTSKNNNNTFMSSGEKAEYIISEDKTLDYLSNVISNECVKHYGRTEYYISSIKVIDVAIENSLAKIYMQFLYSGYMLKDDFFLRQASSNGQVAVVEVNVIDNGDETLDFNNPVVLAISKNDNEYQDIVKNYFPQSKYLNVLTNREETLEELQDMENASVEDYISSEYNKMIPYGDYERYYSYKQK